MSTESEKLNGCHCTNIDSAIIEVFLRQLDIDYALLLLLSHAQYSTTGVLNNSLDLINFGLVNKTERETYILVYNNNENNKTVFPGKLDSRIKFPKNKLYVAGMQTCCRWHSI